MSEQTCTSKDRIICAYWTRSVSLRVCRTVHSDGAEDGLGHSFVGAVETSDASCAHTLVEEWVEGLGRTLDLFFSTCERVVARIRGVLVRDTASSFAIITGIALSSAVGGVVTIAVVPGCAERTIFESLHVSVKIVVTCWALFAFK